MTGSNDHGWILVTNDDGLEAPGLVPLAAALAEVAPIHIVVPDRERSWIGKAITRFDPVRVTTFERGGFEIHACTGYPADCVQLGVHILFPEPPSLVVSGINIGYNHGSAFIQSSGTIGAALEASIAGVASIAFSTGSTRPWEAWRSWVETPDARPTWVRLAAIAAEMAGAMIAGPHPGSAVNVNIPDDADATTERRLTRIAAVGYDRLFREHSPGTYIHSFGGGLQYRDSLKGTDIQAALDGAIAITPIRGIGSAPPVPGLGSRLGAKEA